MPGISWGRRTHGGKRMDVMSNGKKENQIRVRLTDSDMRDINDFIASSGIDLSNGQVLRMAWKYFHRTILENSLGGLIYKLLDE